MNKAGFIVFFALLGCNDEGAPNPAPRASEEVTSSGGGGFTGVPAEPARRTVAVRNPLGGVVGNLLVDGDFELSLTFEGSSQQLGWYVFGSGQSYLRMKTGGSCRSGLRCGLLPSGYVAFGRGTSAEKGGMVASIWAKPPAGNGCDRIRPLAIRCSFATGLTAALDPASEEPDEAGWCFYRGKLDPMSEPTCLYIQAETFEGGGEAILDDARLLPDDGTAPLARQLTLSPARASRLRAIVDYLRERTPIGNPPRFTPPSGR